jgi:hypothetical protein
MVREFDEDQGVMKKCTLCEREPASIVSRARHCGNFNDPDSNVSRLVAERAGVALMPDRCVRADRYSDCFPAATR